MEKKNKATTFWVFNVYHTHKTPPTAYKVAISSLTQTKVLTKVFFFFHCETLTTTSGTLSRFSNFLNLQQKKKNYRILLPYNSKKKKNKVDDGFSTWVFFCGDCVIAEEQKENSW